MANPALKLLRLAAGLAFASFCGASSAAPPSPSILFTWPDRVMIRDAVGIVRVLDKPYGWGIKGITPGGHVLLEGGMKIGIGTKATAAFELYKMAQKSNVVKFVRPFARLFGPVAIASMTLDAIEWIDEKWVKREEVDWTIDEATHSPPWGCQLGRVGASTYTTISGYGKTLVEIVPYSVASADPRNGFGNNCTALGFQSDGYFPLVRYTIVEKFPDIEDVPYREVSDSELEQAISDAVGENGSKLEQPIQFGLAGC